MKSAVVLIVAVSFAQAQVSYKIQLNANDGGGVVALSSEEYAAGVLAGESSTFHSDEALKAMAVAARTYAARLRGRHAGEGFDFCSTTHCQRFEPGPVSTRLRAAVTATTGELLWFDGEPAFAAYTRNCGGRSEAVSAIWRDIHAPYLNVHVDPYCGRGASSGWSWSGRAAEIANALSRSHLTAPAQFERVLIRERTASGRAQTLQLAGAPSAVISASAFRFAVARELGWNTIRSDFYEIQNGPEITFAGKGEGHGVGLCQHGADEMGKQGHSYREILVFYYPGTALSRLASGFAWTPMAGEGVRVLTVRPDEDRAVLAAGESARRFAESRVHLDAPSIVTVRVYPNLDAFRNATGEPGWVAAHTVGSTIDLQPAFVLHRNGALRSVLDHEMLHVVIQARAAPGLPVWFREGLVEYLSNEHGSGEHAGDPSEAIRQKQSRIAAVNAYVEATAEVAGLVKHYGEATVLSWVTRGLPAEVRNSTNKSEKTNSR